MTIFANDIK